MISDQFNEYIEDPQENETKMQSPEYAMNKRFFSTKDLKVSVVKFAYF